MKCSKATGVLYLLLIGLITVTLLKSVRSTKCKYHIKPKSREYLIIIKMMKNNIA